MENLRLTGNRRSRLRIRILCFVVFLGFSIPTASAQSNFPRFNFNVGGGLGIGRGDVGKFVGGSYFGEVGGGLNLSRTFGFNGEYMYYDLPLKPSLVQLGIPDAKGHLHAVTLNGIVRSPWTIGGLGAYGIFGVGFYQRSVSARSEPLPTGTVCLEPFVWWGIHCVGTGNGSRVSPDQTLSSFSKDAGGFNFGAGVTYRLKHTHGAKVYVEARYHRAYHSDVQTTFFPVAVGLRW